MKHLLLAAAAATSFLAAPVFAQSTGGVGSATPTDPGAKAPTTSTNTTSGTMGGDMSSQPAPAQADPNMAQQAPMPAQNDPAMASGSMSTGSTGGTMTTGGYMPSGPAMSGGMTPGATVQFRPAPSPSEAYPAPAPLASYPICKKGQYDKCMQRGGR